MAEHSDFTGSKMGMWLFLYTEIMLFTGLFVLYAAYFKKFTTEFIEAGKDMSLYFGTSNTIVLLISSCAVASSITAVRNEKKNLTVALLCAAWILGAIFLVNKYFEWAHKIHLGFYPNSPTLASRPAGLGIFFDLYYVITGLHGLHLFVGMMVLSVCAYLVHKNKINARRFVVLENSGLYWHLIDIFWIFIFPLFYLIV